MSTSESWQNFRVKLSTVIFFSSLIFCFGVFLGTKWDDYAPYLGGKSSNFTSMSWKGLDEVYSALAKNYDGEIDKNALLDGAKKGLTDSLGDVYTVYMSKEESEEFEKSLHGDVGAGVGIELGLRDGYVRVIRTLPDNPARKAGVLAGDIIYKADDEEIYMKTTEEIAQILRGSAGTKIKLTVVRDGEEKSFDLVRETINNVSAYYEFKTDDTALITVNRFDNDTGTLVASFANDILNHGVKKIILDLRSNGGGYVSAARDLLSLWLDGEKVLVQRSVQAKADELTYSLKNTAIFANTKTIVLVNGNTASASEIVAGALKDYKKATIIGETTFGKGVVQTLLDLSGGSTLKVTTAHWYTPLGNTINKTGIVPDQEVINTYDDTNHFRDPQLDAALAY